MKPAFLEEEEGEDAKQAAVVVDAISKKEKRLEVDDDHFNWSDAGYVVKQEIERIPVDDADCAKKVTVARLSGINSCCYYWTQGLGPVCGALVTTTTTTKLLVPAPCSALRVSAVIVGAAKAVEALHPTGGLGSCLGCDGRARGYTAIVFDCASPLFFPAGLPTRRRGG